MTLMRSRTRTTHALALALPFLLACAFLILLAPRASADLWTYDGSGNWDAGANWGGGTFPDASAAVADFSQLNISGNHTVTVQDASGDHTIVTGSLPLGDTDGSNSYTFNLGTAQTWQFNNNGAGAAITQGATSGANTITAGFQLLDNLVVTNDNTGNALTISGAISQDATPRSITKSGAGTLTLSGANLHSGGTTLSTGRLNINNASALGTGTFTIGAGATIGNTSGGAVTLSTNNPQTWNGNFTFAGPGDLNLGTGAVTMGNHCYLTVSTGTLTVGGVIDDGSSSFLLVKQGTGTLVLAGNNTYGSNTYPRAGTLQLGINEALPNTALWFQNRTGGTIATVDLAGHTETIGALTLSEDSSSANQAGPGAKTQIIDSAGGGLLKLGGAVTYNAGPTDEQHGQSIVSANVDLNGATRVFSIADSDQTNEEVVISGAISNLTGTAGLTKTGAGTLVLAGANSYNGNTTFTLGTIRLGADNAIPSGTGKGNFTMNPATDTAATLDLSGFDQTLNGLTYTPAGTSQAVIDNSAAAADSILTVGANDAAGAFAGTLQNSGAGSSLALVKTGSGTLTLSGANSHSGGTTLSAGRLNIDNATALGTGTFTIESSTTIGNTSGAPIALSTNIPQTWNGALNMFALTFAGPDNLDLGTGAVTLTTHATVTVSAGTLTVGGDITAEKTSYYFIKLGAGTLVLAGDNSYANTHPRAGTLKLGADEVLPADKEIYFQNRTGGTTATVDLAGHTQTVSGLRLSESSLESGQVGAGAMTEVIDSVGGGVLKLGGGVTYNAGPGGEQHGQATVSANLDLNGATRTFAIADSDQTATEVVVSGAISNSSGTAGLTKTGDGTLVLAGTNTYTGSTTVSAGALVLSQPADGINIDRVQAASAVTLGTDATLRLDNWNTETSSEAFRETLGTLRLDGDAVIDLGLGTAGSALTFADSHIQTWSGILSVYNWSGTPDAAAGLDQLLFPGAGGPGIDIDLQQVQFYSDAGLTPLGAPDTNVYLPATGELYPVPEPSSMFFALVLVAAALAAGRRRRTGAAGRTAPDEP